MYIYCILVFIMVKDVIWLFFSLDCFKNSSSVSKCVCLQLEFIDSQGSDKKCRTTILKNYFKVVKITLSVKNRHKT